MAIHDDLLAQAAHLVVVDPGKPKQANLRRAISAAYYALFHFLISEATAVVGSKLDVKVKAQIRRAFAHAEMKQVCASYSRATTAASFLPQIAPLLIFPINNDLKKVASAFVLLQELRHLADYDLSAKFDRLSVMSMISDTSLAFAYFKTVKKMPNTNVFLIDLLLRKSWSRA